MRNIAFLRFFFFATVLVIGLGNAAPLQAADNDRSDVNAFDRWLMFPYSKGMDVASDVMQYTLILAPLALGAVAPQSDWLRIGLLYAETVLITQGLKELTKYVVYRDRPYTYFDDPSTDGMRNGDYHKSFFSGHATTAFTAAAFTTTAFALYAPHSKWMPVVAAGTFGIAAATTALRVGGGMHFLSDALVGAAFGTTVGFLVPYLQLRTFAQKTEKNDPSLMVAPGGIWFKIGL